MRPLPVAPIAGAPSFMPGLCVMRATPVPLVDVGALLRETAPPCFTRFIAVRTGDRRVGLAVEGVHGIRELPADASSELPPLLGSGADLVESMATLDHELLLVLRTGVIVPDDVWPSVSEQWTNA